LQWIPVELADLRPDGIATERHALGTREWHMAFEWLEPEL
jgi:hypothetical protein